MLTAEWMANSGENFTTEDSESAPQQPQAQAIEGDRDLLPRPSADSPRRTTLVQMPELSEIVGFHESHALGETPRTSAEIELEVGLEGSFSAGSDKPIASERNSQSVDGVGVSAVNEELGTELVPHYDDEAGHEIYLQHLEDLGIAIPLENEREEEYDELSASTATVEMPAFHRQISSTFTSFSRDTEGATTDEWLEKLNHWMITLIPPTAHEGNSLWFRHRITKHLWEMRDGKLRAVVDDPRTWIPITEVDRWRYLLLPLSRREHRDLNSGNFPVEGHVWWTRFAFGTLLIQIVGLTVWFNYGLGGTTSNMAESSSFVIFSVTGWIIVGLVVIFLAFVSKMLAKYEHVLARRGEKRTNGFQAPWSPYQFFSMASVVMVFQSFYAILLPGIAGVDWPSDLFDSGTGIEDDVEFWLIMLLYTIPLTIVILSGLYMMWYNPSHGVKRGDSAERTMKAEAAATVEQCTLELDMFDEAMAHLMHTPSTRCFDLTVLTKQANNPELGVQLKDACRNHWKHKFLTKWLVQTQWRNRWKVLNTELQDRKATAEKHLEEACEAAKQASLAFYASETANEEDLSVSFDSAKLPILHLSGVFAHKCYCRKCDLWYSKPKRHHCSRCNVCTDNYYDHHCLFFNRCISLNNYSAFIVCLFAFQLLVFCMIPHSIYMMIRVYIPDSSLNDHATHIWGYFNLTMLLVIWLLIGLSQTFSLCTLTRLFVDLMYRGWKDGEHKTMLTELYNIKHADEREISNQMTMHWTTQLFSKFSFEVDWEEDGSVIQGLLFQTTFYDALQHWKQNVGKPIRVRSLLDAPASGLVAGAHKQYTHKAPPSAVFLACYYFYLCFTAPCKALCRTVRSSSQQRRVAETARKAQARYEARRHSSRGSQAASGAAPRLAAVLSQGMATQASIQVDQEGDGQRQPSSEGRSTGSEQDLIRLTPSCAATVGNSPKSRELVGSTLSVDSVHSPIGRQV